jgi:hypothetical protein
MIQTFGELEIEGNFLYLIKGIYKNSTTDMILNDKRLNLARCDGACL